MSCRASREPLPATDWIASRTSPRGHPNPRPDPPELVLPAFGAAVVGFLTWAYLHWPKDAQLAAWYGEAAALERQAQAAQRAHWESLAAAFCDMFAEDYHLVDAREARAWCAPREAAVRARAQREEEEKLRAQFGEYVLRKYRSGWKEQRARERKAKQRFLELAGVEAKWLEAGGAERAGQREQAWAHAARLVALARQLRPPANRLQAEFPTLWDAAEREAREAVPRDAAVTSQGAAWRAAVLASAQARYAVIVRKARDPARPDGHRKYPLPGSGSDGGGGGGGGGGSY